MKSAGIARRVDKLGRIVVPKTLMRNLEIENLDPVEMYLEGDLIFMKKYHPACIFCDSIIDVQEYKGKKICLSCMDELRKL